jgi:hypothetical protein
MRVNHNVYALDLLTKSWLDLGPLPCAQGVQILDAQAWEQAGIYMLEQHAHKWCISEFKLSFSTFVPHLADTISIFNLADVKLVSATPITTSFSEIWEGYYNKKRVVIKKYRASSTGSENYMWIEFLDDFYRQLSASHLTKLEINLNIPIGACFNAPDVALMFDFKLPLCSHLRAASLPFSEKLRYLRGGGGA